jgi:hypothetical protein
MKPKVLQESKLSSLDNKVKVLATKVDSTIKELIVNKDKEKGCQRRSA